MRLSTLVPLVWVLMIVVHQNIGLNLMIGVLLCHPDIIEGNSLVIVKLTSNPLVPDLFS